MTNKEVEKVTQLRAAVKQCASRSAWGRGVTKYAFELIDTLNNLFESGTIHLDDIANRKILRQLLLNGADDWAQYSYGGNSLIYDSDIAERLCTPSELRRTCNGAMQPSGHEEWLDVQARALRQAGAFITLAFFC